MRRLILATVLMAACGGVEEHGSGSSNLEEAPSGSIEIVLVVPDCLGQVVTLCCEPPPQGAQGCGRYVRQLACLEVPSECWVVE